MSSWETATTSSTHDAQAALNTHTGNRNRDTSSTGGLNFGGYDSRAVYGSTYMRGRNEMSDLVHGGYDMVGIVGTQVEPMRESIRTYVNDVQTVLADAIANAETGMNDAFRGVDAQAAVKEYLAKVKLYVNNLVTQLLSFSDKLADVGNAWQKAQENIGATVKTSTGSFSEGTAYVDNVTYTPR